VRTFGQAAMRSVSMLAGSGNLGKFVSSGTAASGSSAATTSALTALARAGAPGAKKVTLFRGLRLRVSPGNTSWLACDP
jgi:hypothetical protein